MATIIRGYGFDPQLMDPTVVIIIQVMGSPKEVMMAIIGRRQGVVLGRQTQPIPPCYTNITALPAAQQI